MIDLHERLSEFSYGYGATREAEGLLRAIGLTATPFLPSLIHEAEIGFDVAFGDSGKFWLLQFKLGQELQRFRRSYQAQEIPNLQKPFWRFFIDTSNHQFQILSNFEDAGTEVYYVAPCFSQWQAYERAFRNQEILERSLILRPSEISNAIDPAKSTETTHRIVYDQYCSYVCSDPTELNPITIRKAVERTHSNIREEPRPLRQHLKEINERLIQFTATESIGQERYSTIRDRAKSDEDALFAILGLIAWSSGGQLVAITNKYD